MDILTDVKSTNSKLELKHPATGALVGLTLEIRAFHDPECKKAQKSITNRRQKLAAKGKNFNADEINENKIELLLAALAGWEWTTDADGNTGSFEGEQLPFNLANARKLVSVDWIDTQITEELDDATNFFLN